MRRECVDREKLTNSLKHKDRKLINILRFTKPYFENEILKMKDRQLKSFCQFFLESCILNYHDSQKRFF